MRKKEIKMERKPNQRKIQIEKKQGNKNNLYSVNTLETIDEAAKRLQTKAGFKLFFYFAKNQNNFSLLLSSKHFCEWSGVSLTAYNSAFNELIEQGYLKQIGNTNNFLFVDTPQNKSQLNAEIKYSVLQ